MLNVNPSELPVVLKIYIVIPAHNEAEFIGKTLQSLVSQSCLPDKIIVVDDASTDETARIVSEFQQEFSFIELIRKTSKRSHAPGSKVIQAFTEGLKSLDDEFDIICKFDADLIFPKNYLEKISSHFIKDPRIGMVGGFCEIEKNGSWIMENLTAKDHIRGALKAYRKECFKEIGALKPAMGWDTVDELLAQYKGWKIKTDQTLKVKHLKSTGKNYAKSARFKQGTAFYRLRYGMVLTIIASAKLSFKKRNLMFFRDCIKGYFIARKEKRPFLLNEEEGRFVRNLRWQKMRRRLF